MFGEISTGAQNDLQRATDIARAMVTEYGMSEALGAVSYDGHERPHFLGPTGVRERSYAEETARQIDAEVKRLVADAEALATRTLEAHRAALDVVTRALLEREVVDGAWLKDVVAGGTSTPSSCPPPIAASEEERRAGPLTAGASLR